MPTLLTRQPLTEAKALAEVYVVWDGQDYRMTLETLVSLVSKASLGLDKVNNTPDAEKPASTAVLAALLTKANKDEVVSNEAFAAFQETLQQYVTQEQLNTAVAELQETINQIGGLTPVQAQTLITEALAPINTSLQELQADLQEQATTLTTVQQTMLTLATKTEVDTKLLQIEQSLGTQISQLSNGFSQSLQNMSLANAAEITRLEEAAAAKSVEVSGQIQSIVGQIDTVSQLIGALRTDLENHTHTVEDITGLREAVEDMVSELPAGDCNVEIGDNQW